MKLHSTIFILLICWIPASSKEISKALAEVAILTKSEEISNDAIAAAHKALIDVFGISMAGFYAPGVQEVLEQEKAWGGNPQATAWIDGIKLAVPDAAFFNSVLVHALDMDDVHRPYNTHLTSVIVPAAFAVGEERGATGREVIEAIILGIEIAGRLDKQYAGRAEHLGFLPTSIIGGFGAAAASSRLLGLSVEQTMNAFGIFYAHASGNRQALIDRTLTKRIQPAIACRAGVVAAYLAKRGISGPEDIFLSDLAGLFRIYGGNSKPYPTVQEINVKKDYFEIEALNYKKYTSCGASGPIVEAAIELSEKYNLALKDIRKIEVFISGFMVAVPWKPSKDLQAFAQFCAPYQVVSAIRNRAFGPAEVDEKRIKSDAEVWEMAEKVILRPQNEYGSGKQAIVITLKDGRMIENAKIRSDMMQMTYGDIIEKFKSLVSYSGLLSSDKAGSLKESIENLHNEASIRHFIGQYLQVKNQ